MTTTTMTGIQNLSAEYQQFNSTYYSAGDALNKVLATGTVLYNDPTFAALFPNSIVAYQAYLAALQTYINTFLQGLPVAPAITG